MTHMTKHTPGPWTMHWADLRGAYVISNKNVVITSNIVLGDSRDEFEANAYLMAAAPEMLAALKAIRDKIKDHDEWWMINPDRGGFDLDAIERVIAKAENDE